MKEWSDFYEKACGIDEGNEKKTVPIEHSVKYSLLCHIFELLVHSIPTSRDQNFASDQILDILAKFFINNYERVNSDEVISLRLSKNLETSNFEAGELSSYGMPSETEEHRTNLIKN